MKKCYPEIEIYSTVSKKVALALASDENDHIRSYSYSSFGSHIRRAEYEFGHIRADIRAKDKKNKFLAPATKESPAA